MSEESDSNRNAVKKVKPYPFEVQFEGYGGEVRSFRVYELSLHGLVVDTVDDLVSSKDEFIIVFDLPTTKYRVREYVEVIKTYDQIIDSEEGDSVEEKRRHFAEVRFTDLSDLGRRKIISFLVAIKAPGFR